MQHVAGPICHFPTHHHPQYIQVENDRGAFRLHVNPICRQSTVSFQQARHFAHGISQAFLTFLQIGQHYRRINGVAHRVAGHGLEVKLVDGYYHFAGQVAEEIRFQVDARELFRQA